MKRYFVKSLLVAGFAFLSVPAVFGQDVKEKDKKEVQQIIITRKGDKNEKTVIEIKGDKVTVDGKDASEIKDGDVSVRVHKIRDAMALRAPMPPDAPNWNFNFDDGNRISLFAEDPNRAMLGIVTEAADKGAKVVSISKGSAAEKAGLKAGDIITRIDNQKVEGPDDVTKAIRKNKPGAKIEIGLLRDGKAQKLTAELGQWKGVRMNAENFNFSMPEIPRLAYGMGAGPKLGLSVQDTEDGKGVKVLDVDQDGNAAKAGVKENDVITRLNDEDVNSADEISRLVRSNRDKPSIRLQVLRNGKSQTIEVKVPRKLKTADL